MKSSPFSSPSERWAWGSLSSDGPTAISGHVQGPHGRRAGRVGNDAAGGRCSACTIDGGDGLRGSPPSRRQLLRHDNDQLHHTLSVVSCYW